MKNYNMKRRLLALFLIFTMACSVPVHLPVSAETTIDKQEILTIDTSVPGSEYLNKGNVLLALETDRILESGFDYGDIVNVKFAGISVNMPLVSSYSDVDSGAECLVAKTNSLNVRMSINAGNFSDKYGITADKLPMKVTISMQEKEGYLDEYIKRHLSYSDNRNDYPNLTDTEFANFRCVSTTGMGENILYRSATPIDPKHNRNTYNDLAMKNAGVTVVLNLSDTEESAKSFPGFSESYYATARHIYLHLDVNLISDEFCSNLGKGFRYMAQNPGVYDIHCLEGKDRTGFVIAILECFMGATAEEVVEDYMITYYNYYGITKEDKRYEVLANSNIVKTLETVFHVNDLYKADLQACATAYIRKSGLSSNEIIALRDNLRGDDHTQTVVKNRKVATYKSTGYTGDVCCKICGKVLVKGKVIKKLTPKKQTISVCKKASKTVYYRYRKLRRKSASFKIHAKAKGKLTYKVTGGKKKYISVSRYGKVTLKKKARRGTYKVTVYAAATKDGAYKKAQRVVTIRVK